MSHRSAGGMHVAAGDDELHERLWQIEDRLDVQQQQMAQITTLLEHLANNLPNAAAGGTQPQPPNLLNSSYGLGRAGIGQPPPRPPMVGNLFPQPNVEIQNFRPSQSDI